MTDNTMDPVNIKQRFMNKVMPDEAAMNQIEADLEKCCKYNLVEEMNSLVSSVPDVSLLFRTDRHISESPVIHAAVSKSEDVCLILIEIATKENLLHCLKRAEPYKGLSALHCAVANRLVTVVRALLGRLTKEERIHMLHTYLEGCHFLKEMKTPALPLHLAFWCCDLDMICVLLEHGAELDARDHEPKGHTVLHILVEVGFKEPDRACTLLKLLFKRQQVIDWFSRHFHDDQLYCSIEADRRFKSFLLKLENSDGFTPLTWAARIGAHQMMDFILNIEGVYRSTKWEFGPSSYVGYDIAEIDTLVSHDERPGKPNVLEILTYSSMKPCSMQAFSIPIILQLIRKKWHANLPFFFVLGVIHITSLAGQFYLPMDILRFQQPTDFNSSSTIDFWSYVNKKSIQERIFITFLLGVPILIAVSVIIDNVKKVYNLFLHLTRRWHGRMHKCSLSMVFKVDIFEFVLHLFLCCNLVTAYFIVFEFYVNRWSACFSFWLGCYQLLFYLQGFRFTGHFSSIMHYIIYTDLLSFGVIFVIALFSFGGASVIALFVGDDPLPGYTAIHEATFSMFQALFGFSVPVGDRAEWPIVQVLFTLFLGSVVLLLLNMLIGAISETYSAMAGHRDHLWIRSRAAALLLFERYYGFISSRFRKGSYIMYDEATEKHEVIIETTHPRY